ncbi:glycosyltransferase family 1 protein [Phanerochaete sordida]|uniref:Glycosyltransferase family 1 protein n=1 Tax=Phanerochaete sordida TaxID=48140 RepID=A0A9P3GCG3_9APHY|nr:glycosyltransferase family 1 protein [Phanerochaete sordida]
MTIEQSSHIVVAVHLGWGHVRPLCAFAAQVVKLRGADVTFMTTCQMYDQTVKELSRNFGEGEAALRERIRVVGLPAHETDLLDVEVVGKAFDEQFQRIIAAEPVFCSKKETDLAALKPPSALIIDMFGYRFFETARKLSPSLKVVVSLPPSLQSMWGLTGPYKSDGQDEMHGKIQDLMRKTGKTFVEAADEVLVTPNEEIMDVPGLPPLYVYELYPQEPIIKLSGIGVMHLTALNLMYECDAVFSCSAAALEPPETVKAFNEFLALTSRKLYFLGLLLPETGNEADMAQRELEKSPEIASFLKGVLEKHGERSLVYISFGTIWWTTKSEQVWTFLDVLMEKNTPFIMAQASPFGSLPEEVATKVKASGIGLITPWAPQQAILEHPTAGWFVTHSGFNSVTESVHAGVPMICWPFGADQPLNAVQLTENLDIAYELYEVRTGAWGLKPLRRTGKAPAGTPDALRAEMQAVLEQAFGDDGARKRDNIRKLRKGALELWKDGGEARRAADQLLDDIAVCARRLPL